MNAFSLLRRSKASRDPRTCKTGEQLQQLVLECDWVLVPICKHCWARITLGPTLKLSIGQIESQISIWLYISASGSLWFQPKEQEVDRLFSIGSAQHGSSEYSIYFQSLSNICLNCFPKFRTLGGPYEHSTYTLM